MAGGVSLSLSNPIAESQSPVKIKQMHVCAQQLKCVLIT